MEKTSFKKQIAVAVVIIMMLFSLCPQRVSAASTINFIMQFPVPVIGGTSQALIQTTGIQSSEDIVVESSNEKVLPSSFIWIQEAMNGMYLIYIVGAEEGNVTVTIYDKNNPDSKAEANVTFNKTSPAKMSCYVGASSSLPSIPTIPNVQFDLSVEDESVAIVEEGKLIGKKVGETTLHVTYEEAGVDWTYPVTIVENPTGIHYDGEKVDKLEWSKEQGILKIKVIDGTTNFSPKDYTSQTVFDLSNTEIAEIEYEEKQTGETISSYPTGNIILKKNGTVTINAYKNVQRTVLLGTLTIKVTGFAEDAPLAKWEAVSGPQDAGGSNSFAEMMNYGIENNTLNETVIQNQIINQLYAGDVEFSVKIGYAKPDPDFELNAYLTKVLPKINVYEVREDGTRGEIVAAYNKGYTVQSEDVTTEDGWSGSEGTGVAAAILPIRVDSDVLKKGTVYALVLDRTAHGPVESELCKDFEYQFTTVGGAKTVELDRTSASIKPGETLTLTAEMNKGESVEADDTISWKSSNESVAAVDQKGTVTAKKPGTVTITATAVDGKVSAECKITVEAIKSSDITLSTRSATLNVGKTLTLKATVYPANASNKTVTWSSSNPKVATVNASGKVTGKKAGTTVITAKTADGLRTSATITVKTVKAKGVKLNIKKVTRTVGKTKQLKATVRPADATNKAVTWRSSNKKVASVSAKGKVTAKSPGKATITVTTRDGKYKAKAVIHVKPKNVARFTLSGNSRSVVVKYKKRTGIDGYQIYRSETKKGGYDRVATRTKKQAGKYTSIGVRANHTYYYKMRTYKVVKGKKIYSTFSTAKKVRTE